MQPTKIGNNKEGESVFWHKDKGAFGTEKDYVYEVVSTLEDVREALGAYGCRIFKAQ